MTATSYTNDFESSDTAIDRLIDEQDVETTVKQTKYRLKVITNFALYPLRGTMNNVASSLRRDSVLIDKIAESKIYKNQASRFSFFTTDRECKCEI